LAAALAQGSIGRALSALKNPDAFFVQPIYDYLASPAGEAKLFEVLNELEETPLVSAVYTALFLYHARLRAQLGFPQPPHFLIPKLAHCSISSLKEKISYLYSRYHECQFNTNRTLTLFTLLSEIVREVA